MDQQHIATAFQDLQDRICAGLEALDGQAQFEEDRWEHQHQGGGRTRILQGGAVIEKGGVNFSGIGSPMPPALLKLLGVTPKGDEELTFFATGVSIVLHPRSPEVPIIHMNVRYFEMSNGQWWFGGGIDLTPHYIDLDLARDFHTQLKAVCDRHNPEHYPAFKQWADDYFYLKHRQETRGIGGIFFDRLSEKTATKAAHWAFVQDVGDAFVELYRHQVAATRERSYGAAETAWQRLRRGRYVEFNLVWDRGTKFGLDTNGRTESILMSLPPEANWAYCYEPKEDARAAQTLQWLKKGIDWTAPSLEEALH